MVMAVAVVVACGSATTSPSVAVGSYSLVTVNGAPLPRTDSTAAKKAVVTSATLLLGASQTWFKISSGETTTYGTTPITQVLGDTLSGTWTISGSTITFDRVGAASVSATLSGTSITLSQPSPLGLSTDVAVFTR